MLVKTSEWKLLTNLIGLANSRPPILCKHSQGEQNLIKAIFLLNLLLLYAFFFRSSHFWLVVTFGDEVTKIQKYYVVILQGMVSKMEKFPFGNSENDLHFATSRDFIKRIEIVT